MKLTFAGKVMFFLVGVAVLGFAGYRYRDKLPFKLPAIGKSATTTTSSTSTPSKSSQTAPTGVLARVKESGVLRVGMEPDAPPPHYLNDKHQEEGFWPGPRCRRVISRAEQS